MKKILLFLLVTVCYCLTPVEVNAESVCLISTASQRAVKYDFTIGGTQSKRYINEDGQIECLTIEPVNNNLKIANGTYKVSHSVPGAWSASFHVSISSNKISSASNPSASAIQGSISNTQLKKENSTQATLTFTRTCFKI